MIKLRLYLIIILLLPIYQANAELFDINNQQIDISADKVIIKPDENKSYLSGQVVIKYNDKDNSFTLHAPKIEVATSPKNKGLETIIANNGVKVTSENQIATGDKLEYQAKSGVITLKGNVVIDNTADDGSKNRITGNEFIYHVGSKKAEIKN